MSKPWPDSDTFWRDKRVIVTGVSSPYEEPEAPELVIESDLVSAEDAVETILAELTARGVITG